MVIAIPHDLFELTPNLEDPFEPIKTFKTTYPTFMKAEEAARTQPHKQWAIEPHVED